MKSLGHEPGLRKPLSRGAPDPGTGLSNLDPENSSLSPKPQLAMPPSFQTVRNPRQPRQTSITSEFSVSAPSET